MVESGSLQHKPRDPLGMESRGLKRKQIWEIHYGICQQRQDRHMECAKIRGLSMQWDGKRNIQWGIKVLAVEYLETMKKTLQTNVRRQKSEHYENEF